MNKTSKMSRIQHWIQKVADEVMRETGSSWIFTTGDTRKRFRRYPKSTVSSALSRMYKNGILERVERGLYRVLSVYYEHFVSTWLYCGKLRLKEHWYAITHAPFGGSIDKYNNISDAMFDEITAKKDSCYEPEDMRQYQNSKPVKTPDKRFTYPWIEIGRLNRKLQRTKYWRVKIEV